MSKVKKETMWMAWHEPSKWFSPWLWSENRKNLQDAINRQQEFPQEFKCVRVCVAEVKPKRKAVKRGKS